MTLQNAWRRGLGATESKKTTLAVLVEKEQAEE